MIPPAENGRPTPSGSFLTPNQPLFLPEENRLLSVQEQGIAYGVDLKTSIPTRERLPNPIDMRAFVQEIAQMGPGFNDHTERRGIPIVDLKMGQEMFDLWVAKINRPKPQYFQDGWFYRSNSSVETDDEGNSLADDARPNIYRSAPTISLRALEGERIDEVLGRAYAQFKIVEDKLSYFAARGTELYLPYRGLAASHPMWSGEEQWHGFDEERILEAAGGWTAEQLMKHYGDNLEHSWEQPFPTARQIVIYAMFQEKQTQLQYHGLKTYAREQGAENVAKLTEWIEWDEAYHHSGYRQFLEVFHKYDPEGTVADIVYVALNYRMPSLNLVGDLRQALSDLKTVGAYSKGLMREKVIRAVLKSLKYLPEGLADIVADEYGKRPLQIPSSAA